MNDLGFVSLLTLFYVVLVTALKDFNVYYRYDKLSEDAFFNAVKDGPKSTTFTALVSWMSKELQILYSLDDHINETTSPDDSSSFLMELSSFLKEIGELYPDEE